MYLRNRGMTNEQLSLELSIIDSTIAGNPCLCSSPDIRDEYESWQLLFPWKS
jgi:hypothetical protein